MKITNIKIKPRDQEPNLKAIVSITFDNCLALHDIKLFYFDNKNRYFLAMPSRYYKKTSNFVDIAHPISQEFREYITEEVLTHYFDMQKQGIA